MRNGGTFTNGCAAAVKVGCGSYSDGHDHMEGVAVGTVANKDVRVTSRVVV